MMSRAIIENVARLKVGKDMIDIIDKTSEQSGTPINRETLMAVQGFMAVTTVFEDDGSITETNSKGETLKTTFRDDGTITEVFTGKTTSITKTTTFNEDGSISEVIS